MRNPMSAFNSDVDYETRANLHRPAAPYLLASEIRRLAASGLTVLDIASSLQIQPSEVLRLLAGTSA